MPPRQAMRVAQKLYEGVSINGSPQALITYMRTDSLTLSKEALGSIRYYLEKKHPNALPAKPNFYKSKSRNAQEAHEAIRPVDITKTPASLRNHLEPAQYKLYDLIWRRTVASQMSPQELERFSFTLENKNQDRFSGSEVKTTKLGFKEVWTGGSEENSKGLEDSIKLGQSWNLKDLLSWQKFTNPPARYSAASLIKKKEELGIGRPSTYASIISTLSDRGYTEPSQSSMKPTTLGMQVGKLLIENFKPVTGAEMTAEMETDLDKISRDEEGYEEVLSKFWNQFKPLVETKMDQLVKIRDKYRSIQTEVKDPKHGDNMVLKMGRFGEYYQNPNHPEVMYPKNFRELAIAEKEAHEKYDDQAKGRKCEECGKDLIVRVSKSTLKPYIACPDYRVGNKCTVTSITYGDCPQCKTEKRAGKLVLKSYRGSSFLACNQDKKVCGYREKGKKK